MKANSQQISETNNHLPMYFALYLVSRHLRMRKEEMESDPFLVSLKINYKTNYSFYYNFASFRGWGLEDRKLAFGGYN